MGIKSQGAVECPGLNRTEGSWLDSCSSDLMLVYLCHTIREHDWYEMDVLNVKLTVLSVIACQLGTNNFFFEDKDFLNEG